MDRAWGREADGAGRLGELGMARRAAWAGFYMQQRRAVPTLAFNGATVVRGHLSGASDEGGNLRASSSSTSDEGGQAGEQGCSGVGARRWSARRGAGCSVRSHRGPMSSGVLRVGDRQA